MCTYIYDVIIVNCTSPHRITRIVGVSEIIGRNVSQSPDARDSLHSIQLDGVAVEHACPTTISCLTIVNVISIAIVAWIVCEISSMRDSSRIRIRIRLADAPLIDCDESMICVCWFDTFPYSAPDSVISCADHSWWSWRISIVSSENDDEWMSPSRR